MTEPMTTEDEARAAEADAARAEAEAARLANTAAADETVTLEQVEQAEHAGRVARFIASRVRARAERSKEAAAVQARQALRAEILADSGADGHEMAALVDSLVEAALELVDRADAHNAKVRSWGARAKALGVPDRGIVSAAHEGLGVDASGALLVDAVRVGTVNAEHALKVLFNAVPNGLIPIRDGSGLATAHQILDRVGAL